jgi:AraC family transcriptional regulator of adaptative response / DNA-3-methyladenine glycosylase II
MDLDHDACYRVFQARDVRFDGRMFIAVRTTGIYCRPICPARTPKKVNVQFFASAAAARDAGFRPCLRCRPEVAPDLAAWNGTSSTVTRALRLIEDGGFEEPDIHLLAARVGIGTRHLRRLFAKHVGASPAAVLQTRRIHLAKQLIQETTIPMTQVAHASGFGSIRRFNETFKDLFGRPPSELRRARKAGAGGSAGAGAGVGATASENVRRGITLRLPFSSPYAWDHMLARLAADAIRGIEAIDLDRETYTRSISVHGVPGIIAIAPGRRGEMLLRVHSFRIDSLSTVISRVRSLCDLSADPRAIDAHLSTDPLLAPLIDAHPGLRIGGAWAGFEIAVRTLLAQRIDTSGSTRACACAAAAVGASTDAAAAAASAAAASAATASAAAARLVEEHGDRLDAGLGQIHAGVTHLFPTPAQLADVGEGDAALQALARAVVHEPTVFNQRRDLEESLCVLRRLPGIDEWAAQQIAMRELREPDAFPSTDARLLQAMQRLLGHRVTPEQLLTRAERWRPWRAYAAAHILACD